jgi:surface antigen
MEGLLRLMTQPRRGIVFPVIVLAALGTGACQQGADGTSSFGPKTGIGAALGAAGGGLLGAAAGGGATGIAAGVLLGGLLGGATGSYLDDQDKRTAAATTQQALDSKPSGTTTTWRNPDSGNSGSVTPIRTYQADNGRYCREYEQTVTIGGKPQKSYGTACRQPDGTWQIVS